jgi:hypothetical protein
MCITIRRQLGCWHEWSPSPYTMPCGLQSRSSNCARGQVLEVHSRLQADSPPYSANAGQTFLDVDYGIINFATRADEGTICIRAIDRVCSRCRAKDMTRPASMRMFANAPFTVDENGRITRAVDGRVVS